MRLVGLFPLRNTPCHLVKIRTYALGCLVLFVAHRAWWERLGQSRFTEAKQFVTSQGANPWDEWRRSATTDTWLAIEPALRSIGHTDWSLATLKYEVRGWLVEPDFAQIINGSRPVAGVNECEKGS